MSLPPALLIAGTSSHSGKTATAIALISALRARGHAVLPAKCGPDYIDAGWLAQAAGRPCLNLDIWMCGANPVPKLAAAITAAMPPATQKTILVIEGAMGLYDGDRQGRASCAELAARLQIPILLLVNARGASDSCAAMANGFLTHSLSWMRKWGRPSFCGVICTHTGSGLHRALLAKALKPVLARHRLGLCGFLDAAGAPKLPERHLGLVQAGEIGGSLNHAALGQWFENNCNLDAILKGTVTGKGREKTAALPANKSLKISASRPVIAVARDEAFAFCYAALPELLHELGGEVKFFSPLRDVAPPPCSAVYLPGGYPEEFARPLAANEAMRASLCHLASAGVPIYGECGGYMYLMRAITDKNGQSWPMCGIIPQQCQMTGRLAALGYRRVKSAAGADFGYVRGHEYHYARICGEKSPVAPLWQVWDSAGRSLEPQGWQQDNVLASWIHLYPAGSLPFWRMWMKKAAKHGVSQL